MADRETFRKDIETLICHLARRPGASMHLVWSSVGSGKTHALHYMAHIARSKHQGLLPIYTEFPRSAKGFLDLYSNYISGIDLEYLANACFELKDQSRRAELHKELKFAFPDLLNALEMFYVGEDEDKEVVSRWIRTDPEDLRELKERGINRRIDRPEEALKVMRWASKLLTAKAEYEDTLFRFIWMIDEYQRIETLRSPVRDEINGCLQAAFNRCPKSLTIMLSFSGKPEKKLPGWVSPELADRIGAEKTLLLPELGEKEAFVFVRDLLAQFRDSGKTPPDPLFPFTGQSTRDVVKLIMQKGELRPRRLMEGFNAVLQEAEIKIELGELAAIDTKFAEAIMKDMVFAEVDE